MRKINLLRLISIFYLLFFAVSTASAAGLTPLFTGCGSDGICDYCDFLAMAQRIIKFLMFVGIPITVLFILYGAGMMMISAGSPEKAAAGRKIITDAVLGLVIALSAWIIVNTIFIVLANQESGLLENWWKLKC